MSEPDIAAADSRMAKSCDSLRAELAKVRSGRAHAGLLEHIAVSCYGAEMPLSQTAAVAVADAHTLLVSPWDKQNTAAIEKAIREAGMGLNPSAEADRIRVSLPLLSEDRRRELTKIVKREAESARVAVRSIRRDSIAAVKERVKSKKIGEDEGHRLESELQNCTDKHIGRIDEMAAEKESELMRF